MSLRGAPKNPCVVPYRCNEMPLLPRPRAVHLATTCMHDMHAGLMATQAGSIGRLVGNFSISVFGGLVASTIALANVMFLSFAAFVAMCAVLFAASYGRLRKSDA